MTSKQLKAIKPLKDIKFARHSRARDDEFDDISTDMNNLAVLNVLGNDLGGKNRRKLWSLDDGDNLEDLRQKDGISDINLSQRGAHIWITDDGKVAYAPSSALQNEVKGLGEGQFLEDSFIYATRQGVGPLHWATATVKISGVNNAPELTGTQAVLQAGKADMPYTLLAADLSTGYVDPENDPLSITGLSASYGTLTETDNGWLLTPETGYIGPVILNYLITDGQNGSTEATLKFDLLPSDDDIPPVLVFSFPWNDFEGFKIDANIELNFNEEVKAGQGRVIISNGNDERIIDITDTSQVTFLADYGKFGPSGRVIINPTDDLIADTTYHIRLDSGVITDKAGNPYEGIIDDAALNFGTVSSAPSLQWSDPWDDQSGFKADNNIQLFFDEPVQGGQGNIILSNGSDVRVIDISDASQVSFDAWGGVIINPTEDLEVGKNYHVRISEGAIIDLDGNAYAGINDETILNFATTSSNPVLVSSNLPGDEAGFQLDGDMVLSFDEPVQAGQGNIILSNGSDTRIIDIHDTSQVTFNFGKVTINPAEDLIVDTDYHIRITEGAIADLAGIPFAGINDETTLNFRTISSGPFLTGSNPWDGAEEFSANSDITLYFSEVVQPGNGEITLSNGADIRAININDASQVTFNQGKVTINPLDDLVPDTSYHIRIGEHAIVDAAGNPYAGIHDDTILNFAVTEPSDVISIIGDVEPELIHLPGIWTT
ncbi:MAG: hypothetical protein RI993_1542 [Pseudomonadota bacterium]|jgi:VCBS repeat-containing protein